MDILWFILSIVLTLLGWIFAIVWWFLSFLFMPLLILAVIGAVALRFAWRTPMTKPYVERWFQRLGERGQNTLKNLLYMVTVEPFRVIFRFIGFSILYAFYNLLWKPKWTPFERARQRPKAKKS